METVNIRVSFKVGVKKLKDILQKLRPTTAIKLINMFDAME